MVTAMTERLNAAAWTEIGLRVLADQGVEAVRVEPLARALGVTKGSFYWHFSDRRELLDSMLLHWKQLATHDVIETVERASDEPAERLRELTRLVFRHGGPLDRAVRAWASTTMPRPTQSRESTPSDTRSSEDCSKSTGLPAEVAARRAHLLYTSLVGEQHTSLRLSRKRRVDWALRNLESLLDLP